MLTAIKVIDGSFDLGKFLYKHQAINVTPIIFDDCVKYVVSYYEGVHHE